MRNVIATEYVSVVGIMGDPGGWTGSYCNDEPKKLLADGLSACDALLSGRVTYQEFAAACPTRSVDDAAKIE